MAKPFSALRGTWLGLDDQLGFGMHQGYTVLEILKDRPDYIQWLIDNTGTRFYPSVIDELTIAKSKYKTKPTQRRYNQYFYDGGARGDMAHESLTQMQYAQDIRDWFDDDIPF